MKAKFKQSWYAEYEGAKKSGTSRPKSAKKKAGRIPTIKGMEKYFRPPVLTATKYAHKELAAIGRKLLRSSGKGFTANMPEDRTKYDVQIVTRIETGSSIKRRAKPGYSMAILGMAGTTQRGGAGHIMHWLEGGTKTRYRVMSMNYISKSRPYTTNIGSGRGYARGWGNRPGIKARNWREPISKDMKVLFEREFIKHWTKMAKAYGWDSV